MLGNTYDSSAAWSSQVKFEMDKPVRMRYLSGWKRGSQIFYPSLEGGKTKIVSMYLPDTGGTVFDDIADLEEAELKKAVVATHGGMTTAAQEAIKKVRSKFRASNKWYGLCFQRSKGPQVMIVSLPYSAWQQCENIRVTPFTDQQGNVNTTILQHGPLVFFDLIVRKYREGKNSNPMYDTTWSVEVTDNKFAGRVPAEFANCLVDISPDGMMKLISKTVSNKSIELNAVQQGVFLQEEIAAILSYDHLTLDKTVVPATPAYIKDKLDKYPIFPQGLDKEGRTYYDNPQLVSSILSSIHVNMIEAPKTSVTVGQSFGLAPTNQGAAPLSLAPAAVPMASADVFGSPVKNLPPSSVL